jgi:hypothetical protein
LHRKIVSFEEFVRNWFEEKKKETDLVLNTKSVPQTFLTNPSKPAIYLCKFLLWSQKLW